MNSDFGKKYGPAALVTGASSGIGLAIAEVLAEREFDLVLAARRGNRLEDIAARLAQAHGVSVRVVEVDLVRPDATEVLLDRTADLDIGLLVSNAGFSIKGDHAGNDRDTMADMLMVNCHAPLQLTRGFIPRLRARGKGGIVLTSSVEGLIGCPYSTAYSATKALVKALGEGLWAELRSDDIDVLTLCPGATETEAGARSGVDMSKLTNVMKARDVAELALDNIGNGPTFVSSEHYRALFDRLLAMPRREALIGMAEGIRRSGVGH